MAFIRPVTLTKISSTTFGQPVFDWITANTPTAWTAVTFTNGWSSFGSGYQPVQYRKIGDIVYCRGTLSTGTGATVAFTLPAGFRPPLTLVLAGITYTGTRTVLGITVNSAGQVTPELGGNVDMNVYFSTVA